MNEMKNKYQFRFAHTIRLILFRGDNIQFRDARIGTVLAFVVLVCHIVLWPFFLIDEPQVKVIGMMICVLCIIQMFVTASILDKKIE